MTPISKAFSLDLDGTLTLWVYKFLINLSISIMFPCDSYVLILCCLRETLNAIMTIGHSRVPVYAGNPTNIIGYILVCSFSFTQKVMVFRLLIARARDIFFFYYDSILCFMSSFPLFVLNLVCRNHL